MKIKNYVEIPLKQIHDCYTGVELFLKDPDGNLYKLEIGYDDYPKSPREWDNICTIVSSARGDWNIADKGFSFKTHEECMSFLDKPNTYFLPIYMYDHSGQTISLSSFNDPWDSGVCGFIFVTKEQMQKAGYDVSDDDKWYTEAANIMAQEIETYDKYICGETYSFILYKAIKVDHQSEDGQKWSTIEYEIEDSCAGFYGSDLQTNGILDYIPNNLIFIEKPEELENERN